MHLPRKQARYAHASTLMTSQKGPRSMHKFHFMNEIWQDREIRFDVPRDQLGCSKGEFEIDSINSVEDTKGNNGKRGFLVVTNLRVIWAQHKRPRTNLSIGFNCITSINIKTVRSKLRGNVQGLYVMTKVPKPKGPPAKRPRFTRFEFIFTSLVRKSPRLFTTVQAVVRGKSPPSSTVLLPSRVFNYYNTFFVIHLRTPLTIYLCIPVYPVLISFLPLFLHSL